MRLPRRETSRLVVPLLSCLMVVLLAMGWVFSGRLVGQTPPLVVATGRTAASFVVIALLVSLLPSARASARVVRGRPWAVAVLAFLGFFAYYTGTLLGVDRIGASRVGVVVSLLPCLTFVIGLVAFRERSTSRKVVGTVLAVAGSFGYAAAGSASGGLERGLLITGVGLALAGTFTYALYGYVYRQRMPDVSPLAGLLPITGVATVMLGCAAAVFTSLPAITPAQWAGTALLGAVFTAPVFLISHELILRKGPLFTAAVALLVPFLVRLGEWALGTESAPDVTSVALLMVCCAGVWLTVSAAGSPAPDRAEGSDRADVAPPAPVSRAGSGTASPSPTKGSAS